MINSTGNAVAGSGTSNIKVGGSLEQINGDLARLSYTAGNVAGNASVSLTVTDQAGLTATGSIDVTVTTAPTPAQLSNNMVDAANAVVSDLSNASGPGSSIAANSAGFTYDACVIADELAGGDDGAQQFNLTMQNAASPPTGQLSSSQTGDIEAIANAVATDGGATAVAAALTDLNGSLHQVNIDTMTQTLYQDVLSAAGSL